MLHDHVLSDSCNPPFAASSRLVARHQSQDGGHVHHVTWTGYPAPRYDVISAPYVYSQRPTSSSMWRRDVTPVTAAQCPYVGEHLSPITDHASTQPATFFGCMPDDRLFTCSALPCSSSAVVPVHRVQFGAGYSSSDGVVNGWQLERPSSEMLTSFHSGRTSALTPMNCELTASSQRTFNNEAHHEHQQLHSVSSSSQFIIDDDGKHQFGTRPTRASTSIGMYYVASEPVILSLLP